MQREKIMRAFLLVGGRMTKPLIGWRKLLMGFLLHGFEPLIVEREPIRKKNNSFELPLAGMQLCR